MSGLIDTRFPPQPERIKVPLYSNRKTIRSGVEFLLNLSPERELSGLQEILAVHYNVPRDHVYLAGRGVEALFLFFKWFASQQKSLLRVAIPAFCCPEVCHAILAAHAEPVFLEIEKDFSLSEESVYFAYQSGCQILLWPQFFGPRPLSQERLLSIQKYGMLFINDEAQSFPERIESPFQSSISLFSFGHSKMLSGFGGGGIVIHDVLLAQKFSFSLEKNGTIQPFLFFSLCHDILKKRMSYFSRSLARRLGIAPSLFSDLKNLLEKKPFLNIPLEANSLSYFQAFIVNLRLKEYLLNRTVFLERVVELKRNVSKKLTCDAISFIENIFVPSIFAVRIPSDKRYILSGTLATYGIQTTWYYYPLNRLRFLSQFPSQATPITDLISAEILILPFQWRHSASQYKYLLQTMENFNNESISNI